MSISYYTLQIITKRQNSPLPGWTLELSSCVNKYIMYYYTAVKLSGVKNITSSVWMSVKRSPAFNTKVFASRVKKKLSISKCLEASSLMKVDLHWVCLLFYITQTFYSHSILNTALCQSWKLIEMVKYILIKILFLNMSHISRQN